MRWRSSGKALAWAFFLLAAALTLAKMVFLALNWGTATPHIFSFRGSDIVFPPTFATIGLLIALKHPRNPIGWMFLLNGCLAGVLSVSEDYAIYALFTRPSSLPGAAYSAWIQSWLWMPLLGLTATVTLPLFPDGRLLSKRWRGFMALCVLVIAVVSAALAFSPGPIEAFETVTNPLGVPRLGAILKLVVGPGMGIFVLCTLVGAASLVERFRRSGQEERDQVKWILVSGALFAVTVPFSAFDNYLTDTVALAGILSVPLAIGISILKHRLYDIDLVISRGLVYVPLTAMLAGLYIAATGLFKTLFAEITGAQSEAAVAATTLVIVALFAPMKDRLQALVNRRFGDAASARQRLVKYEADIRPIVQAFNTDILLRRFLEDAVTGLEAEGGAVYVGTGAMRRLVSKQGSWNDKTGLTMPLQYQDRGLGDLVLGRSRRGGRYTGEDLALLSRCVSLTATALVLGADKEATVVAPASQGPAG